MSETNAASGRDFSRGIELSEIPADGTVSGRVGDEPVLLSRFHGKLFAVSGTCTHYGGHLADGVTDGMSVRCPLHHACFDLRTGEALRAPALDPVDRWLVEIENDRAFVRRKAELPRETDFIPDPNVRKIVIVGGGAAGLACANELRKLGFAGDVTLLSADCDPPCDRPNLSKDYLAGTAPEEWLPLRTDQWYSDNRVELRLSTEVTRIDPEAHTVHCSSGITSPYDKLLIATGSEPNRLESPGFDSDRVFTLRTIADARAIADQAEPGKRAVVIGASFIAMEAAAALRNRQVDVEIVSPEHIPFERVFGSQLGKFLQDLHEKNGVRFHLGGVASGYANGIVTLPTGERLDADFVLVGIGVRPRTTLARSAGAAIDNGVMVDPFLETAVPGIYAAGDIASYPSPASGERVRIEHWAVAERQGQVVAANMLGARRPFESAPFFWTEQFGTTIRYVGHATAWDQAIVEGEPGSGSFLVRYLSNGVHCATASIGRDRENLQDELKLENVRIGGGDVRES